MALDDFKSSDSNTSQSTETQEEQQSSKDENQESNKRYVEIDKEEFEQFLSELPWDFEEKDYAWTKEYVYEIYSKKKTKAIRIYSSVDKRSDSGRDVGSDAIRVVLLQKISFPDGDETWRPLRKEKRTNRIKTWRKNLKKKIENIVDSKDELKWCDECDRLMIIQKTKENSNSFWGCTGFYDKKAQCTNTEPIN